MTKTKWIKYSLPHILNLGFWSLVIICYLGFDFFTPSNPECNI